MPDALAPQSAGLRTVGGEEELLIVDPATGEPLALAGTILEAAGMAGFMTHELKLEQLEMQTPPCREHGQLLREIASGRRLADWAAQDAGARVAALGTSPLGGSGTFSPGSRFAGIGSEFALTALEQLTCALHVHVGVTSPEEGVAVLDRVRDWLPLLTALSANSPFWQGADTGYAGFRTQVLGRWPTAGPQELHGTPEVYRSRVEALIGALLWHLAPVLRESGELPLAEGTIASLFEHGTGARVQREAAAHGGHRAAVNAAIERTAPEPSGAGGNGLP